WMKRATTTTLWLSASPQASDAAVNRESPVRKTSRRPSRSPSRPAKSSRPPKEIRYALTTQARLDWEKPRSVWILGRATFTIVASRTIMSMPAQRTTRAIQRERSEEDDDWAIFPLVTDMGSSLYQGLSMMQV